MISDLELEISATELSALSRESNQGNKETKASDYVSGSDKYSINHQPQLRYRLEENNYISEIKLLHDYLDKVNSIVNHGGSDDVLKAAVDIMASVSDMLSDMSSSSFIPHSRI